MDTKQNVTFSVIMPCYNSQSYVRGALQSIVEQTYPHWELIAVNDGSTDDTLSILNDYATADSRIKVFSKPNGGYISAVNLGLEKITGDYFLLIGSDDAFGTDLFHSLAQVSGNPDVIAFRSVIVQDGVVQGVERITNFSERVSEFGTSLAAFSANHPGTSDILFTRDTSKCYKRSLLGDLRYFGRYGYDADGIFSMLLCHNATSFAAIPVDGYYWTLRGDSLSGRKSFYLQDCDRVENWTRFYAILLDLDTAQIAKAEKEYLYYYLGILQDTWKVKKPFLGFYTGIKAAAATICKVMKKTGFQPDLDRGTRLMLHFPLLWKLLHFLKKILRK